jgi:AraC-like DNA-binding protein
MPRDARLLELLSKAEAARSPRLSALANLARAERDPRVARHLREALIVALGQDARPDDPVARAIELLERDLARNWSVEGLARAVGLSRAAFARRFRAATGSPPERFWIERRMQRASELLRQGDRSLAEIAGAVGYGSEFALSRAFKRWAGVSPGQYRKERVPLTLCQAA